MRSLSALLLLLAAAPCSAAPALFPRAIRCGSLKFYTRLGNVSSLEALPPAGAIPLTLWDGASPEKDESAAWYNDFRSAAATRERFFYAVWGTDTSDYWYSFDMAGLLSAAAEPSRRVLGQVVRETGSYKGEPESLVCAVALE